MKKPSTFTFFWILLLFSSVLRAQTPQYSFGINANTNTIPMSTGVAGGSTRCQFIYQAGDFGTVPSGMGISTIYLRAGGTAAASSYTNFQVDVGQSNVTMLAGTAWETGLTTALTVPTFNVGALTAGQWVPITFNTPIPYDPSLTLIIDLRYSAFTGGFGVRTQSLTAGRRQYANYATAAPTANSPQKHDFGFDLVALSKATDDASISALVAPVLFCAGTQDIRVKLANRGRNILNNVTINWTVDGVPQTPYGWSSPLDTLGSVAGHDTTITLGSLLFAPNVTRILKVWTSLPNGNVDTVPSNDSITVILRPALNGTYTVAPVGADFSSVSAAVKALNDYGICGPAIFEVASGSIYTEDPISLLRSGTATDSIVFKKSGTLANPLIYGRNGKGALDAIIALAGVNYVTFDGIDVADSVSNANTTTQMEFGYAVVNATPTNGSSHNVIRNCRIVLKRSNTASVGLIQSHLFAATSLTGGNHENRYENLRVENVYGGILLQGTTNFPDSNNIITGTNNDSTVIGAATAGDIGGATVVVSGINVTDQKNVEVSRCVIRNLSYTSTSLSQGIWVNNVTAATNYGTARIFNNKVYNVQRITTTSATGNIIGIRVELAVLARALVYNNLVYGIESVNFPATPTANQVIRGISHGHSTGTGFAEYYNNTVSINSASANTSSSAFWKGSGASVTVLRNNIFSNTSVAQTTSKHYAVFFTAGGSLVSSHNVYWVQNANGFIGSSGGTDRSTLPVYAASISGTAPTEGNEQGSAFANPNFISATDYNFSGSTPVARTGVTIPGITTDINGTLRDPNFPSVGAYETTQPLIDSSAPVINVTVYNGTLPSVYATITDNSNAPIAGDVKLWYRAGTSGAFTALSPDSTPTGGMNGTYKWGTSITSLSVGIYQFYIAARDNTAPGLNIAVNPIHTMAFAGFNPADPVNYAANPDASVNVRTFAKLNALPPGTYAVGASHAPYFKLTDVANILNTAELTGDVTFELASDYDGTTGEIFPITFFSVNSIGGPWSVTIRPASGVVNRETSGYPASAAPLISLNGTTRVTFDGRPGGTGTTSSWTIRTKRTSSSSNSPCFVLTNGAQRNRLTWLKIENDNTTAASGAVFLSGTSAAGNSFNEISNSMISGRTDSTGVPATGIYSSGTAGFSNDSNIIINNAIYNWTSTGVHATSTGNGANWNISGNSFYMTTAPATAQTSVRFEGGVTAANTRISDNFIGGNGLMAGGAAWTNSGNIAWRGIVCAASQTDSSYIENNTIQNINLTGGTGTYAGIEMTGALAAIRNNTVGHAVTTNSIQTSQLGTIISIWLNNAANRALIENNLIANVTSTGNTTAVGHNGIRIATGVTTAPLVIRNNMIYNLRASNPTTSTSTASMVGILSVYAGTQQTIRNNTVYDLSTVGQANTSVFGINVSNASGAGTIEANKVYGLNNTSNSAVAAIAGIHLDLGAAWNVVNNMVSLGYNVDSAAVIAGINNKTSGSGQTFYFNTVLISGTAISTVATQSYAYRRTTAAASNISNNILMNTRSGGTGNYAVANTNATPATGWTADYNDLYSNDPNRVGLWLAADQTLGGWKTVSVQDLNSISTAASFISATDLHLTSPTLGDLTFAGNPVAGITTDFDGETRHASYPYIGADESISNPLPVVLVSFSGMVSGNDVVLNWNTATERNNSGFYIERSMDAKHFEKVRFVAGKGFSTVAVRYHTTDDNAFDKTRATLLYYRLRQLDFNGRETLSEVIKVNKDKQAASASMVVAPNPFTSDAVLILGSSGATYTLSIVDMQGRKLSSRRVEVNAGAHHILLDEMNNLQAGVYFVRVEGEDVKTIKVIKTDR